MELFNDSAFGVIEIKNYFEIFSQILRVEDDHTRLRIEFIFGIPQVQIRNIGSEPYITRYEGKYSEKLISYYSPILYNTNHLSVIDQLVKYLTHSELPIILTFFFTMVTNNVVVFNYFDNCPSPAVENET